MIVRLKAGEGAAWRALRLEALQDSPPAFLESYEDAAAKPVADYERQIEKNHLFAWRDADGTLAGSIGFYVMNGYNQNHRGYAWGMYVRPSHRGKGTGSALVKAMLEHAATCVRQVHLGAETTNAAAIALYRKCGFEIYGTDPGTVCIDGVYYDDHLMVKKF